MSEYRVLETASKEDLNKLITVAFCEGWRCQGGVSIIALGDDNYLYAQAMIRASFGVARPAGEPE